MPRLASGGSPPAKRCVARPRTRRDVILAPPLPGRGGAHAHYARNIRTRIARGGSPPRAARWGHRALPPLPTRGAHQAPKYLCAPLHPAQTLFVFLCVQNFRTTALAPPGIVSRGRAPPAPPRPCPVVRSRHTPPGPAARPRTARHTKKAASQSECRFRIGKPSRFSRVRHFA